VSDDNTYGKEFLDKYLVAMGSAWRSVDEEAKLVANPTAYAAGKGLPVEPGAVVKLDRTQPEGMFTAEQLVRDWTAKPGEHILHVPAEELISEADLTDTELETIAGGGTDVNIACYVG
jgi:hypothetical protein